MRQTNEETKRKNAERSKKWREEHPDYMKEYMKEYRQDHSEEMKAADRKYHAEHRDEQNEKRRQWRKTNPEKQAKACREWYDKNIDHVKDMRFKAEYGITKEEFDILLAKQNNRCKLCRSDVPRGRGTFHVDHDHKTGKVRGLLCHHCNTGLGYFKEKAALLRDAALYLENEGTIPNRSYVPDLVTEDCPT